MKRKIKQTLSLGIGTLIIIAGFSGCNFHKNNKVNTQIEDTDDKVNQNIKNEQDEFVKYENDGSRVNISPNVVNIVKKMGQLEFKNIKITEAVNITTISADVYNTSDEIINEKYFTIRLLNKEKDILLETNAFVGTINPGEYARLNKQVTIDVANAESIEFIEKK